MSTSINMCLSQVLNRIKDVYDDVSKDAPNHLKAEKAQAIFRLGFVFLWAFTL